MEKNYEIIFPNAEQFDAQNAILNRIADKLGAYDEPLTWAAVRAQVRAGGIGHYLQPGDQVEVDISETVTASVFGDGISAASVDKDTFLAEVGTHTHDYEFSYNGTAWHYNGNPITLSDYGISVTGTPQGGDVVLVHRSASMYDFDVLGIDEDEPVNTAIDHVVTISSHPAINTVRFDIPMYLYAVTADAWPDGLPAGTYNIILDHAAANNTTAEDCTVQFSTTETIPVGGGIRHSYMGTYYDAASSYKKDNVLAGTFTTYAADTVTTIETGITTTEGDSGTNLGTTTAYDPQYKVGDYINYTTWQIRGSNRWSISYMRQYLNSDDEELVWEPKTIWSRNSSATVEGFLHSIDPELRAVLCKVKKRYLLPKQNNNGYEDVEDYVTPLTRTDVFGIKNNGVEEGPVDAYGNVSRNTTYTFWKLFNTNADKIKYRNGEKAVWYLASCTNAGNNLYCVNTSGASGSRLAGSTSTVISPCMCIG